MMQSKNYILSKLYLVKNHFHFLMSIKNSKSLNFIKDPNTTFTKSLLLELISMLECSKKTLLSRLLILYKILPLVLMDEVNQVPIQQ